jgi:hypothetical protein
MRCLNRSGGLPRRAISGAGQSPPARHRPVVEISDGTEAVVSAGFRSGPRMTRLRDSSSGYPADYRRAPEKHPLREAASRRHRNGGSGAILDRARVIGESRNVVNHKMQIK